MLAICIVCCVVIPGVLEGCWDALAGRGLSNVSHAVWGGAGSAAIVSPVYSLFSLAVSLASVMFFLVASMRASIYGRLGPGFQVPRLWAMMRHDMKGLLRVLGLSIVLAIVPAVVTGIVGSLLVGGVISVGAYGLFSSGTAPDMMFVVTAGMCLVVVCLALAVVVSAASAFAVVMQARAVGYWTRQFDVPAWRGQDAVSYTHLDVYKRQTLFPVDDQTLAYLRLTGRSEQQVALVEQYAKAQGFWNCLLYTSRCV